MTMADDYTDRMQEFAQRLIGYKTGEMVSLMIHIGDELGLYEAMAGQDRVDAASLAEATGLDERWCLEWLRGQGAAGIIDHLAGGLTVMAPLTSCVEPTDRFISNSQTESFRCWMAWLSDFRRVLRCWMWDAALEPP
jgi:hypothetical protein